MLDAANDRPLCFNCGYWLRGLDLPRPCPECGRTADPATAGPRARSWFAGRRAAWQWLLRPSRVPAGVCYVLADAASQQVLRRRERRWLWMPALLAALIVGGGHFVAVRYEARIWYFDKDDPNRTPLREVKQVEDDRLFATNEHLFRDYFGQPTSWVGRYDRRHAGLTLSRPTAVDPVAVLLGAGPLLLLVLSYAPARALYRHLAAKCGVACGVPELELAAVAAWSLIAPSLGRVLWLWVTVVAAVAAGQFTDLDMAAGGATRTATISTAAAAWALILLAGCLRLVRHDRAKLIAANGLLLWAWLAVIALAAPLALLRAVGAVWE